MGATEEDNSLLKPLKQRKVQTSSNKIVAQSSMQQQKSPQSSPQLRRKLPTLAQAREKNQPSIADSLLRMPKGVTVKKTTTTTVANNNSDSKSPVINKSPRNVGLPNATEMASSSIRIGDKNVKIQRLRVTKAQAEAMAKEGRIKMKDGQMILNRDN